MLAVDTSKLISHFNPRAMNKNVFQAQPEDIINAETQDFNFTKEVKKRSGVNLNSCWHCRCCSGGCPFFHAMDMAPNAVIRLVQLGLKDEALRCSAIWICVGCHTCSSECPQAIDMSAMMDTLRQIAIEEGVSVAEPDILKFHNEVLKSIENHGRTHKLEIMLRYKVRKRDFFSDINVGLKMLAKRKLDLKPSKIHHIEEVQQLFSPEFFSEGSDQATDMDLGFAKEVARRSGVNLSLCWHCRGCSGGCPFAQEMDIHPNAVIRLVQLGFKEEVLKCSSIWVCVGCHTCSSECPQAIDMSAIMDTLRQMAIEEGVPVAEPDILNFHNEVLKSIDRYGRTHKLEIMLRYKAKKLDLFSDINVGLRMFAKRKLDLKPSKVNDIEAVHQLFSSDISEDAPR